jgi:hypothetical protein
MSQITLAQSRMYQIPTREIETELGLDSMDKYIARGPGRQLRWLGNVSRMPFDRLPRRLLSSWLPYKRPRGAPEMTFGKTVIKTLKTFDIDPKHWPAMRLMPIVPIGAIGSINHTFRLRRRVNTQYLHVSTAWKLCFHVPHVSCLCSILFHVLRGT